MEHPTQTRKNPMSKKKPQSLSSKTPQDLPPEPQTTAALFHLTPKQTEAFNLLTNDQDISVLYGGAKGGGKSFLLCLWIVFWAKHLIKLFSINAPLKYPLPIGFVGRKRAVDFNDTTFDTFKKIIPGDSYTLRDQDKEIVIENRVKILYGGLDDSSTIKKFNSAELAFTAIDQAEETGRTDVGELQASLRLKYNGIKPPYKRLWTANPAECWLKQDYILSSTPAGIYIPAKYTDNPHLPPNYDKTLEQAFGHDENLLKAYRDGDWDAVQSDMVLIPSSRIEALKGKTIIEYANREFVSLDPSQGGDEAVVYIMQNTKIVDKRIYHEKDTMLLVGYVDMLARQHYRKFIVIDGIGIGAPIGDRLREIGYKVFSINSASESTDPKCYNLRTQMWFYAAELIRQGKCEYPEDEELRNQLSSVRYKIMNSSGEIQLEPKELTKRRIGRSPDRADAFIYALWSKDHGHFGNAANDFKRDKTYSLQRSYDNRPRL